MVAVQPRRRVDRPRPGNRRGREVQDRPSGTGIGAL